MIENEMDVKKMGMNMLQIQFYQRKALHSCSENNLSEMDKKYNETIIF